MKSVFSLFALTVCLTACNSSDLSSTSSSGGASFGDITLADDQRNALTLLPDIAFNGQYETTARPELGIGREDETGSGSSVASEASVTASPAPSGESADSVPYNPGQTIQPGTLTAGDYDDHLNPYLYQNYAREYLQRRGQWVDVPRIDFNQRIGIEVTNQSGQPYADARVEVLSEDAQSVITLHTPANGVTSVYSDLDVLPDNFILRVTGSDGNTVQKNLNLQNAIEAGSVHVTLSSDDQSQVATDTPIDVMFVIDSTGSMTDELQFLQTELSDIISAITAQRSNINIGLVFYRDYGDDYIVRAYDFSANLNGVQLNLNQEYASGGGDYPEAMDQALQAAIGADWRSSSRKVLFLLADAPPHSDRMRATWAAAEQARLKNIHLVPVAASGVGEDAEYIMRSVAALTSSRYLFLTDDSGYGLSHAEPEIDCYVVTSLRKAMIRALNSLVSGARVEPSSSDIIRQVGDYDNGVCKRDNAQ